MSVDLIPVGTKVWFKETRRARRRAVYTVTQHGCPVPPCRNTQPVGIRHVDAEQWQVLCVDVSVLEPVK